MSKTKVSVIGLAQNKQVPVWARDFPWIILGRCAQAYHIDINLLAAIIKVESAGNQYVTRFEPKINRYFEAGRFSKKNTQLICTCLPPCYNTPRALITI